MILPLIYILAAIVIAGVIVWGLMQMPMDPVFKNVARVLVVVVLVVYVVLVLINLLHAIPAVR